MNRRNYFIPNTLDDAVRLVKEQSEDFIFFAGGTDIQLHIKQKLIQPVTVIDLSKIESMKQIRITKKKLEIGGLAVLDDLIKNPQIREKYPIISHAAKSIATPVIRKTATIAGNLKVSNRCSFYNQSYDWRQSVGSCLKDTGFTCQVTGGLHHCYSRNISDMAPVLIALNAQIFIRSPEGKKKIPLKELYVHDGLIVHSPKIKNGIITHISLPVPPEKWWYKKLRIRNSMDFTSLTMAGAVTKNNRLRICINGVSMAPVFSDTAVDEFSIDELIRQVKRQCKTVDNDYLPLKYRRAMIGVFLKECLESFRKR